MHISAKNKEKLVFLGSAYWSCVVRKKLRVVCKKSCVVRNVVRCCFGAFSVFNDRSNNQVFYNIIRILYFSIFLFPMTHACDTELCDTTHDQSPDRSFKTVGKNFNSSNYRSPLGNFASEAAKVVVACMSAILTVCKINYNHPINWMRSDDILAIQ